MNASSRLIAHSQPAGTDDDVMMSPGILGAHLLTTCGHLEQRAHDREAPHSRWSGRVPTAGGVLRRPAGRPVRDPGAAATGGRTARHPGYYPKYYPGYYPGYVVWPGVEQPVP